MSYTEQQHEKMVDKYGRPDYLTTVQEMTPEELEIVRSSMKNGRSHDITLYIRKDNGFIFIAKPFYPTGLYRAPSGGILPGEDFETGAKREAREETGVDIELDEYVLRIGVRFQSDDDYIDWVSYVFTANYTSGEIKPLDNHEIKEARLILPEEIPTFMNLMLESGSGGLRYRAYLTRETDKRL